MNTKQIIIALVVTFAITTLLGFAIVASLKPLALNVMKNVLIESDLSGGKGITRKPKEDKPSADDMHDIIGITYQAKEDKPSAEDMQDTISKLQKRVDQYGTRAHVYQQGRNRINVEVPAAWNNANAILLGLGKPGSLVFQDSDGNTVLAGSDIADAQGVATTDHMTNQKKYVVELTLNDSGKAKFAEATQANIGKSISIVYDGATISTPTVQSAITDGKCEITGMESIDVAKELASTIQIGVLSLELEEEEVYTNSET